MPPVSSIMIHLRERNANSIVNATDDRRKKEKKNRRRRMESTVGHINCVRILHGRKMRIN